MDKQDIEAWTCQELIRNVYHELNQKTVLASSFLEVLLNENAYGFVNDEQKKVLARLQKEVEVMRTVTDMMRIWSSANEIDSH